MKLLFRMTPQGSFYTGSQLSDGCTCPFPRSDTVFKAILNAWNLLWGDTEVETLLDHFSHNAQIPSVPALCFGTRARPFYISSIFPVVDTVYFLPRPISMLWKVDNEKLPHQIFQNISWVSAAIYRAWLEHQTIDFSPENFLLPSLYCDSKEMNTINLHFPNKVLWSDEERTRNTVDRATAAAHIYPTSQVFYGEKLQEYIVVDTQEEYRAKLEAVLRLLADEGIGGQRSNGCGSYIYYPPVSIPKELDFIEAVPENSFVTLSLYYPSLEDVQNGILDQAQFQLIERQGWSKDCQGNALRQQKIRLFKEGSHFSHHPIALKSLVEMKSNSDRCYHYVYPFPIAAPGVGQ